LRVLLKRWKGKDMYNSKLIALLCDATIVGLYLFMILAGTSSDMKRDKMPKDNE
jgi:hypothetical protein